MSKSAASTDLEKHRKKRCTPVCRCGTTAMIPTNFKDGFEHRTPPKKKKACCNYYCSSCHILQWASFRLFSSHQLVWNTIRRSPKRKSPKLCSKSARQPNALSTDTAPFPRDVCKVISTNMLQMIVNATRRNMPSTKTQKDFSVSFHSSGFHFKIVHHDTAQGYRKQKQFRKKHFLTRSRKCE
jgi:hypothetical protein